MEMYVLVVTFRQIVAPSLIYATHEAMSEYSIAFEYLPCGVSKSKEKLEKRAEELRKQFRSTFDGYQIIQVQEF